MKVPPNLLFYFNLWLRREANISRTDVETDKTGNRSTDLVISKEQTIYPTDPEIKVYVRLCLHKVENNAADS